MGLPSSKTQRQRKTTKGRGAVPDYRTCKRPSIFRGGGRYKRQRREKWPISNVDSILDNSIGQDNCLLNLITALLIQEIVIFRRYTEVLRGRVAISATYPQMIQKKIKTNDIYFLIYFM